jgi:glycerate 2-kinase
VRALASPASLKGVLSAVEASMALAAGLREGGVHADELPVADGGEGTAEVFAAARGGEWRSVRYVEDPLGREIEGHYLVLDDGTAVVEAADVIGLSRLAPDERNVLQAKSIGLFQLVSAAVEGGAQALIVCLGDTATVDGGAGAVGLPWTQPRIPIRVACDVRNPLLGVRGAARAFGPQKGASPEMVEELERRLASLEELRPFADLPGAGAGGGLGAAFAALGAELVSGAELVLDLVGFRWQLPGTALVVTGEGTVDRSTVEGKAVGEVVRVCGEEGVRCEVFGGRVEEAPPGVEPHTLSGDPNRAADDLVELGERLARAVGLGLA